MNAIARRRLPSPVPMSSIQGTLALDLHRVLEPPAGEVVDIEDPVRRRFEQWARRYVQAAVEIVGGDRPAPQLLRWTAPEVYADLVRRALLVARAAGRTPGQGRPQGAIRPQVVSVRASFVDRQTCEVSVRVRYGERFRAVAVRFETIEERLQCTALEFA